MTRPASTAPTGSRDGHGAHLRGLLAAGRPHDVLADLGDAAGDANDEVRLLRATALWQVADLDGATDLLDTLAPGADRDVVLAQVLRDRGQHDAAAELLLPLAGQDAAVDAQAAVALLAAGRPVPEGLTLAPHVLHHLEGRVQLREGVTPVGFDSALAVDPGFSPALLGKTVGTKDTALLKEAVHQHVGTVRAITAGAFHLRCGRDAAWWSAGITSYVSQATAEDGAAGVLSGLAQLALVITAVVFVVRRRRLPNDVREAQRVRKLEPEQMVRIALLTSLLCLVTVSGVLLLGVATDSLSDGTTTGTALLTAAAPAVCALGAWDSLRRRRRQAPPKWLSWSW